MTASLASIGTITYADSSTGTCDVAYPASIASGELLVLFICSRGGGSSLSPGGSWTNATSASSNSTNIQVYYKTANGTESGTNETLTNNLSATAIISGIGRITFSAGYGLATGSPVVSTATGGSGGFPSSGYSGTSVTINSGALVIAIANLVNNPSALTFSAEAIGSVSSTTEVLDTNTALGGGASMFLVTGVSTGAVGAPTLSATESPSYGGLKQPAVWFALEEVVRVTDIVLTDTAVVTELLAKDSYRASTDSVSATDTLSKTFDWTRSDSVSTTESALTTMYFVRSVSVSDTIATTDSASNYDLKLFESPQSITDFNQVDFFNTYSPSGNDTITIVEDFYRGIEYVREINENIALTEQLSYVFGGIPVLLSAIGPRTLRADFATIMSDNAFLVAAASYTVSDHSGNTITVLSVSKASAINPISVTLQLAADLQSGRPYTLTVIPEVQSLAGRSPRPSVATWYKPRGNFQIPISRFGGEIQGGLFGTHGGLVFFSPALTNAIANSVIQVEDVKACTKAFDTYSFPQPIDPPALYTYVKGGENTPVSRVGTGHVWGKWPLLNETKVNFGMPHQTETYVIGGGTPSSFTGTLLSNEGVSGDTSFGTSFTYTEGSSTLVPNGLTIQSVLVASDSIIALLKIDLYPVVISDTIAITDTASYWTFTERSTNDTLVFSDSIEIAKNNDLKLVTTSTDALVITESTISAKAVGIPLTDTATITDQFLRYLDMVRSSNDTLSITESNNVSAERFRTVNDTSTMTEQLSFLPKLTSLDYTLADTGGGDTITITGKYLSNATGVTWGGVAGSITGNTATTLTFTTPAKAAGTYSVVVTSNGGISNSLSLESWDPSQIPNVMAYFDSRKGLSTSGADILSWTDQISSTVYSSALGFRPTLVASALGSRPGVNFNNSGGYQPLSGTRRAFASGFVSSNFYLVGKLTTTTSFAAISDSSSAFVMGVGNSSNSPGGIRPAIVDGNGTHLSGDTGDTVYTGYGVIDQNQPFLAGWDWYVAGHIADPGGTIRRIYNVYQNGILQNGKHSESTGNPSRPLDGSMGFSKLGESLDGAYVGAIIIADPSSYPFNDLAKLQAWSAISFGV